MIKKRLILSVLFSVLMVVFILSSSVKVAAFFPSTHGEMSKVTALNKGLNEDGAQIYQSGAFLADLGHFYFDKLSGEESDSELFATLMKSKTEASPIELQLFSEGWQAHVIQDTKGSVLSVFPDITYHSACNLFAQSSNLPTSFYICPQLIISCYEEFGFTVTQAEIYEEIWKTFIFENIIRAQKIDINVEKSKKITEELERITQYYEDGCAQFSKSQLPKLTEEKTPAKIVCQPERKDLISMTTIPFSSLCHLEVTGHLGALTKIEFVISDKANFDKLCDSCNKMLRESGKF